MVSSKIMFFMFLFVIINPSQRFSIITDAINIRSLSIEKNRNIERKYFHSRITGLSSAKILFYFINLDMSRAKQSVPVKSTTSSTKGPALSWKEKLHPEDYEQLRATFDLFDSDGSGYIDPE